MSGQSYLIGWLIYLVAALSFLGLSWYLSRGFHPLARWPLRALLAALLLFPWRAGPEHPELAPAWLVTAFDSLFREQISVWRAGGPLVVVVVLAVCAGLAEYWRSTRGRDND